MPRLLTLLALVVLAAEAPAGAKKESPVDTTSLRSLAQTRGFMLGRPMRPTPTPDGSAVLFLRSGPRSTRLSLFSFDVASGKTRELLTPAQVLKGAEEKLSPEEKARRERQRVSVGGFTNYQMSDDGRNLLVTLSGQPYLVERATAQVRPLKVGPGTLLDPKFSPDGTKLAYVLDHDVYVLDLATEKETRLTTGGTARVAHGTAEFVAQEEMGRFSGFWWSPDSAQIAYQQTDNRGVEVWYVADPIDPGQKPQPFHYPRPGKTNAKVRLFVVPSGGGVAREIAWDAARHPYLATVRWSKHGPLSLVVQSRDQREVVLLTADPKTGTTTPLLTEHSETWVSLFQEAPRWLPGRQEFLWIAERGIGPQLEWRTRAGRLRRVLVAADAGFQNLVSVDDKATEIVYSASTDPTQSQLLRLPLGDAFAAPTALTEARGQHAGVFTPDHALFVHTARPFDAMPTTTLRRSNRSAVGTLPAVAEEPPADLTPTVEIKKVGQSPGYYAAIVRPHDFDPAKKYPVIVDVYGGPHHLHVHASRQRWLLDQWYADRGFIVVALDGRGTPGRGYAWERAIYQKFGDVPLADQIDGLHALAAEVPQIDLARVGIDGWSFGGYLAALATLRRPAVFRAAVAGAPVCDWYDYDTHYTERYLGVPATPDDAVYRDGSLLTYTGQLRRPLLVMHGTADDNVYFRHTLRLVQALFREGKEFEVLPLSGLTHMVPDPLVMERLHGRIAAFFRAHLGRPQ